MAKATKSPAPKRAKLIPKLIKWYGCRPDSKDQRDRMMIAKPYELNTPIDLRPHCPPVMDQGAIGSCTAHGTTGAYRYLLLKDGKPDVQLSRLQLYYNSRFIEGTVKEDAGAEIRDVIKVLAKQGVAHEKLWPYKVNKFATKPPATAAKDALTLQALTYERVPVSAAAIKSALAQGFPVIIGISVFESFESDETAKTGIVNMPTATDAPIGGHCMFVVGWGQKPGYFTVQNSWADDWGDHGYCYVPEGYLGSPAFGSDYWILKTVESGIAASSQTVNA